jgi:fatty acid desaturase
MARKATLVLIAIGLAAFFLLLMFGFAIWVFIPLFPAGLIFVFAVLSARKRATRPAQSDGADTNSRKAA